MRDGVSVVLKGVLTTELHSSRSTSMTASYIGKNQPVNPPEDVICGKLRPSAALLHTAFQFGNHQLKFINFSYVIFISTLVNYRSI